MLVNLFQIKAIQLLTADRKVVLGSHETFAQANNRLYELIQAQKHSDIVYNLQYFGADDVTGTIDCEPLSFWNENGSDKNPLTWHLFTFFGNLSRVTNKPYIKQEDIDWAKEFLSYYQIGECYCAAGFLRMKNGIVEKVEWFKTVAGSIRHFNLRVSVHTPSHAELKAMAASPYEESSIMIVG